jgi:hypothetical protein
MRKVFFHIHIWKTAGSTFLDLCRNNFGSSFHRDVMLIQEWFLSVDQLRWLLSYHPWLRCYSCHMISGNLPYDYPDATVVGIAFVRNPIKRFISSYHYMMDPNYRGGYPKDISFEDFFSRTFVDVDNPWWRNGQVNMLAPNAPEGQALIQIRERMDEGQLVLLVSERFDESCIVLERMFPDDFKDCSYIVANVSPKKKPVPKSELKPISEYVEQSMELFNMANDYLDAKLDLLFPDPDDRKKYMNEFKNRCRVKSRNNKFKMALKSVDNLLRTQLVNLFKAVGVLK